jgi:hypothetical protein
VVPVGVGVLALAVWVWKSVVALAPAVRASVLWALADLLLAGTLPLQQRPAG